MNAGQSQLGEVVEIIMGQAPPGKYCNKNGIGEIFVKAGEFSENGPEIREWTTKPLKIARPQDVLVCVVGATAGKVCTSIDCAIGRSVAAVRPRNGLIDSCFLFHFLRTEIFRLRIRSQGVAQGVITRDMLRSLVLVLPPLDEQKRIAAILDKADGLRRKRRQTLELLDTLKQSVFVEMFGDEITSDTLDCHQAVSDVLQEKLQNGAYFQKDRYTTELEGTEMVHMSDAFQEMVKRGQLKRVLATNQEIGKYSLSPSDILIARRSLTLEGAAKPCRIPLSTEPLVFESSFIRIRPDLKKTTTTYLYHYLKNKYVRDRFLKPFITQSTISGINQSNFNKVLVAVPNLARQQKVSDSIEWVETLLNKL